MLVIGVLSLIIVVKIIRTVIGAIVGLAFTIIGIIRFFKWEILKKLGTIRGRALLSRLFFFYQGGTSNVQGIQS